MPFEIVTISAAGLELSPVTIGITMAMDEAARSFEAKVKQPGMSQAQLLVALRNSPPCTIRTAASDGVAWGVTAGGNLVLTGHVEKRSPRLGEAEAELAISGRSKTGDVVDSAADHESGEFRDKKAPEVLGALAGKQNVKVESELDHPPRELFRLRPGETIFTAAERWSRAEGFAIGDTPEGNLALRKAGSKRHAGSLTEGRNVRDASAVHDDSKRFGKVKVRAQAPDGYAPDDLQVEDEAGDTQAGRQRLKVIVPPEQIRKKDARKRAQWHRDRAAGEGTTCEVTVTGWRDEGGTLWQPGWLIFAELPSLDVIQDMLIKTIKLDQQGDGEKGYTRATLGLVDPRAFGGKQPKGAKSSVLDLGKIGGDDA
ncbi:hypothetical protein [Bosea sp. BK604]|uniref:phage baseplate assembly protein n=1 Tax=Bosea sp. BK604 TaxID=2512180 RepID=UPI00104564E0|nr:hypothetical protein [Bosea sp. BK604]TCR69687.1 prophage tail gpP-like protein [Bosea sp. BK604]